MESIGFVKRPAFNSFHSSLSNDRTHLMSALLKVTSLLPLLTSPYNPSNKIPNDRSEKKHNDTAYEKGCDDLISLGLLWRSRFCGATRRPREERWGRDGEITVVTHFGGCDYLMVWWGFETKARWGECLYASWMSACSWTTLLSLLLMLW